MKRLIILTLIVMAACLPMSAQRRGMSGSSPLAPPLPKDEAEKKILAVLDEIVATGRTYAHVPPVDGRIMRVLAESSGAKHVVEIGTSTGVSGLWFCLALRGTGGKLTTFEIDPGRAAMAREHFRKAGVDKMVTIIEGDAHQTVTQLKGTVDVVFIDADKEGYTDYLEKLLPLVRPGGLILAHNVGMGGVDSYLRAVTSNPNLETVLYSQGGGLSITVKKH